MQFPSLSILIPAYNRADLIRETLESIARQDLLPDNLEVIVSDDGSKDETSAIVQGYQDRLPGLLLFRQEQNLGGPANWAFCLAQAKGDLVFLLSHDDAIPADFLRTYLELFRDHPTLDMVFGDIELRGPEFQPLQVLALPTPEGVADGSTRLRAQLESHHMVMSTMYRRTTLLAAGAWDAQVGSHLDCNAFCRTALRARSTYRIARPMLHFRISPGTWSHRLSTENQRQLSLWYRRKLDLLHEDAKTLAPELLPFLYQMYARHARIALCYLETELGNRRRDGAEVRKAMDAVLEVFPEGRAERVAWKLRLASYLGTGWLRLARRMLGRPDPYQSDLALFNDFSTSLNHH